MENNTIMRLIHYGSDEYQANIFRPISDVPFRNKPRGGLWTSPVGSEHGWAEWCAAEVFGELEKSFEIQFEGRLLVIDGVEDMMSMPWIACNGTSFISFQALCAIGFTYDAIHLTIKGERETRYTFPESLYGWDCESVLILNPDSIQVV